MTTFLVVYDKPADEVDASEYGPHYRGADMIDGDKVDTLFIFREVGVADDGGDRWHVMGTGVCENITIEQAIAAFEQLLELP